MARAVPPPLAALAMHWQRVTRAARRAGQPQCGLRLSTGVPGPGWQRAWPRPRPAGGHLSGPGSGYLPGVRVTRKVGQAGTVTVTQTVARLAARARGPARRRDSFDIADSELEGQTVGQAGCQCPALSLARRLRVLSRPERSGSRRRAAERRGPAAQRTGSIDAPSPVAARGRAPSADWPHACTDSAISTVAPAARLLQPPLPRPPAVAASARRRRKRRPIGGEVEGATDEARGVRPPPRLIQSLA